MAESRELPQNASVGDVRTLGKSSIALLWQSLPKHHGTDRRRPVALASDKGYNRPSLADHFVNRYVPYGKKEPPLVILHDNETTIDLLNNEAIAKTIIALIR